MHSTDTAIKPIKARRDVLRGGLWRDEVLSRIDRLENTMRTVYPDAADPRGQLVSSHVAAARSLANGRAQVREWWTGSRVEAAWRHLRIAEEVLFEGTTGVVTRTQAGVVLVRGTETLGPGNAQVKELKRLLGLPHPPPQEDLIVAASVVMATTHDRADREYRALRQFRNGLRILNGLLVCAALLLLGSVRMWGWTLLPPTDGLPSNSLVAVAMFFGSLGALFSAVPSLSQLPSRTTPFSPVTQQAILKVVVGAWSAVLGLMAVAAGLGSASTSQIAGFAMVAALFGSGQEAITRFADHKAGDLRSSMPTDSTAET